MKQREVTDNENTRWTCVQAFTMVKEAQEDKAAALSETTDGKVTVVCTPSGGAKTVRLELHPDWDQLKDEDLVNAISNAAA